MIHQCMMENHSHSFSKKCTTTVIAWCFSQQSVASGAAGCRRGESLIMGYFWEFNGIYMEY